MPTTFNWTGAFDSFVVPAGWTSLAVECWGAGGAFDSASQPGLGGYVAATIPVTPGETLRVYVGGTGLAGGGGGFNGGGNSVGWTAGGYAGGGATDIRRSPYGLADRLVVAGGGGGSGGRSAGSGPLLNFGGDGGVVGLDGHEPFTGGTGGGSGFGATAGAGGAGGSGGGPAGSPGVLGIGGDCGRNVAFSLGVNAGGGGGGLYGGGGAEGNTSVRTCGGGGGSSGVPGGTMTADATGVRNGNGLCVIDIAVTDQWHVGGVYY